MKRKGTKNLTFVQRLMLEQYLSAGLRKQVIAERLGVCRATVYNEIKRGAYMHKVQSYTDSAGDRHYKYVRRYSPNIAEDKYRCNMQAKGVPLKVGNDYDFVHYVEKRIVRDKLSPCAVWGELQRNNPFRTRISKTTMYRYVATGVFLNVTMQDLPFGVRRKRYRKAVAKRPPKGTSIERRPACIAERQEFGHWEMDCVIGKQYTRNVLLTLTERMTRRIHILRMPNKKAANVVRCLNILERQYGKIFRKVFKTITVDNGSEFSDVQGLEQSSYRGKRVSLYYCHPYTSCERGTNERLNREVRRLLPKGTDFSRYTDEEIQAVEDWINAYPREIFGYATSAERFAEQIAAL